MRILIVIHNQHGSGPYSNALRIAAALAVTNEVTLLCTSRRRRLRIHDDFEDGVRVVQAPDLLVGKLRQGLDPWNTLRRIIALRGAEFDIVHAIDCRPAVILPALWFKWRRRIPLVLSWFDLFGRGGAAVQRSGRLYAATAGWVETMFEERFRRFADRATVVSSDLRRRLLALGYPPERVLLQRVGFDVSRSRPRNKGEARRQLDIAQNAIVLAYVGSLFPSDARLLLESITLARSRYSGEIITVMTGPPILTSDIAEQHGIRLMGFAPLATVDACLCAADLCLLPMEENVANRARWPSKVGDYCAAGRPMVTTRVSDLPSLVAEHGLGYLASADTASAFADAIMTAINDRASWDRIGEACVAFAAAHLEITHMASELVELYAAAGAAELVR